MAEIQALGNGGKPAPRPHSPDDLERCIRVTPPSAWVILAAFVLLLAGLLCWGFFGTITTKVSATGTVVDGGVSCFLSEDDVALVHAGDEADVKGTSFEVAALSDVPLSRGQIEDMLGGSHDRYLAKALVEDDWSYMVRLTGDTSTLTEGVPLPMEITVERLAPINLVLGSAK